MLRARVQTGNLVWRRGQATGMLDFAVPAGTEGVARFGAGPVWQGEGARVHPGPFAVEAFVLSTPDTIAGDASTTSTLAINGPSASSLIDVTGDQDWFRIELTAGESYAFALNGSGLSPLSDAFLELYNASGTLLSLDDDGGPGNNSMMQFTATQSGVYYVSAEGFEDATGEYTISAATGPAQDPLDTLDLGFTFAHAAINVYFALTGEQRGPSGAALRDFTVEEIASVMSALATIADVTDLTFAVVGSAAGADFVMTLSDLDPGVLGQTWPDAAIAYIELAPDAPGWTAAGLQPGGLGYSTIIHEAGHALGLAHPHLDGGDVQVMQGVVSEFDSYGAFQLNQQVFTIMSYNDGWPLGPNGAPIDDASGHAAGPMALDIALLQQRYGADTSHNVGDTTYLLGGQDGSYVAIWDAGGVDTIDANTSAAVVIDLRAATLLNAIGGGGYLSYAQTSQVGFTIAAGVVIENASGGPGDDIIIGNAANNVMRGGGGTDTFIGDAGADTYFGSFSPFDFDIVSYELSPSAVSLNLSTGAATGDAQGDMFFSIEAIAGTDFNDSLTGSSGRNVLVGLGGNDVLVGLGGADALDGGDGVDTVSYAADNFVVVNLQTGVNQGDAVGDTYVSIEIIAGTVAGDVMTGDAANNMFVGGGGADTLTGGAGDDTLEGGGGADRLDGGEGSDTISYANSFGPLGVTVRLTFLVFSFGGDADGDTFVSIENIIGSSGGDGLFGTGGANRLEGGAGNDDINGYFGDDVLFGGVGADNLEGGAGADAIDGGDGLDSANYRSATRGLTASLAAASVNTDDALGDTYNSIENLIGSEFADALSGDAGVNVLAGANGDDALSGEAGNDTLRGEGGIDALFGGDGDDVLIGGIDADSLDGGAGTDTADYSTSSALVSVSLQTGIATGGDAAGDTFASVENVTGSAFNDTLIGRDGLANVLNGGGGNDTLIGGAGSIADVLNGGGGNDTLVGGAGVGADVLNGGGGIGDLADYSASLAGVTINLALGTGLGGDAQGDTLTAIENLSGSGFGDTLTGDISANTLFGGAGGDQLSGNGGADSMFGGDGDDVLIGGAGADALDGGADAGDVADYSASFSGVTANLALGTGFGGDAQGDTLTAIENLSGSGFGDTLTGNMGANRLSGKGGDDSLFGGDGDDILIGGAGGDALAGGAGIDGADYSSSGAGVVVNLQTGSATGGDAAGDTFVSVEDVIGSEFNDTLSGRDGFVNVLSGGLGDDVLSGGVGADTMHGGDGIDTLDYSLSPNGVDVRLFSGAAAGGAANGDTYSSIENIIGAATKTDTLAGDTGANMIWGGGGNETITGREGADTLHGEAGNDTLLGGADSDTLIGGIGADTLGGGAQDDLVDYSASNAGVTVNLQTGLGTGGHAQGDVFVSIEDVTGSDFADVIVGKNNLWDNVFDGRGGNDTYTGGLGNDVFVFRASSGADAVTDFSPLALSNNDAVQLIGFGAGSDTFAEVIAAASQVGADTVIDFGAGQTLTLQNVTLASLTSDDFIFGS